MSSERGNTSRSRPQKHKNSKAFKNDLHDKTPKTKKLNTMPIENLCERCRCIIEWKIKYRKYKALTAPKSCSKCHEKRIKNAYHTICLYCAACAKVCPKCGKEKEIISLSIATTSSSEDRQETDRKLQELIRELPERKKRSLVRKLERERDNDARTKELVVKFSASLKFNRGGEDDEDSEDYTDLATNESDESDS